MQSCTSLAFESGQKDPECIAVSQECDELYQRIGKKLGKHYKLINQFDAAKNHEQSIDNEFIYQQGFRDCVYLLRWIGML